MTKARPPEGLDVRMAVLECLHKIGPCSLGNVRDWVGRHMNMPAEWLHIHRFPSGKEIRTFEQAVANELTPGRASNLTGEGLVRYTSPDRYELTDIGRQHFLQLGAAIDQVLQEMLAEPDDSDEA